MKINQIFTNELSLSLSLSLSCKMNFLRPMDLEEKKYLGGRQIGRKERHEREKESCSLENMKVGKKRQ